MSTPIPFSRARRLVALALILLMVAPGLAVAQAKLLDGPRASGAVGERFDGFAVVRSGGADIQQLVDQVNAERRSVYADVAAKEGTNVDAVGRIYADRIIQSAPGGTWFLDEGGNWRQK